MTRRTDSHDDKRQELRDWCQVAHCRKESDMTFKGVGLCDAHWSAACQDGMTTLEYLRENLVEDAILAIDWS